MTTGSIGMLEHTARLERARYRGQFVLGPSVTDVPENWQRRTVAGSLYLLAHPDLSVAQATSGRTSISLIGYLLDPSDPEASDSSILNRLLSFVSDWPHLLERLAPLGGRWVLIVDDGTCCRLLHDPLGLRQVFFMRPSRSGAMWCASQPGMLARIGDLRVDEEVLAFVRSRAWPNGEHWLPGDLSPFNQVKHLLPNHYLDFASGRAERYWPVRNHPRLRLDDSVERCAAALSGLMRSAYHRFSLAICLTAGWDSRLVLAASRPIAADVLYMTLRMPSTASADVEVPALLLKRLGLRHEIVHGFTETDRSFQRIFAANVPLPHPGWAAEAWAILRRYGYTRVAVTGSGGEVGRRGISRTYGRITPDELCSIWGMTGSPFALRAHAHWLSGLSLHDYYVLDLYYWEQRAGNWLAAAALEIGDVAWQDIFTPYNCRSLLETMIAVDVRYRWPPRHALQARLIRRLWAETLANPINPHKKKRRSVPRLISYGREVGKHVGRALLDTAVQWRR